MTAAPPTTDDRLARIEQQLAQLLDQRGREQTVTGWGRWLDLPTASIYSSLSVKSLRRAIAAGRLTGHRLVAGKILLDRREIDGAIAAARDQ